MNKVCTKDETCNAALDETLRMKNKKRIDGKLTMTNTR
jgi:hypothetical protein